MEINQVKTFHVIGISVRTTNENGQATQDIPALWERFFSEGIPSVVTNKSSDELYCIYTDYEKDHTKPYTTLLGYRVENLDSVPEGLTAKTISGGDYTVFAAKGKVAEPFVYEAWQKIWNSEIDRAFTADFEIYGEKSQNPETAEVEIYIALK